MFTGTGLRLVDGGGELGFSRGLAHIRLMRVARGEPEALADIAELRPGDAVVDGTLGMAQDALVAALAVGTNGKVIGLEASLPIFALVSEGLRAHRYDEGSARLEVRHHDSQRWLVDHPDSAEVVVLDPMFRVAKRGQPGFDVLRRHACNHDLSDDLIEAARVCARRWVVVKVGHPHDLDGLGVRWDRVQLTGSAAYARVGAE